MGEGEIGNHYSLIEQTNSMHNRSTDYPWTNLSLKKPSFAIFIPKNDEGAFYTFNLGTFFDDLDYKLDLEEKGSSLEEYKVNLDQCLSQMLKNLDFNLEIFFPEAEKPN
jgi:hypothetical protein